MLAMEDSLGDAARAPPGRERLSMVRLSVLEPPPSASRLSGVQKPRVGGGGGGGRVSGIGGGRRSIRTSQLGTLQVHSRTEQQTSRLAEARNSQISLLERRQTARNTALYNLNTGGLKFLRRPAN